MKNSNFSNACREISQSLLQITELTKNHTKSEIKRICTKYSLDKIPKNYEASGKRNPVSEKPIDKIEKITHVFIKNFICPDNFTCKNIFWLFLIFTMG